MIRFLYAIFTVSVLFAIAQGQSNHTIVVVKDFVGDFQQAVWQDQTNGNLYEGVDVSNRGYYARGYKQGNIKSEGSSEGTSESNYGVEYPTINVRMKPSPDQEERTVRGAFTMKLPDLKLLQLEADYDLLLNDRQEEPDAEFYVEVWEKKGPMSADWQKAGEIRQPERVKIGQSKQVLELQTEQGETKDIFVSRSFNADLSKWSGKEVKVVLTSQSPFKNGRTQSGRWIRAQLMGATFSYKLGG